MSLNATLDSMVRAAAARRLNTDSRTLAADNLDSQGRRRNSDRTPVQPGSLLEVSRAQGVLLRRALNTATIRSERTNPTPAPVAPNVVPTPSYEELEAMAKRIPAGRYALPRVVEGGNDFTFFQVGVSRKTGRHFIETLAGAPGAYQRHRMSDRRRWFAMLHILEDLEAASKLYGLKSKVCGRCSSPLTAKESLDLGWGPKCKLKRFGG